MTTKEKTLAELEAEMLAGMQAPVMKTQAETVAERNEATTNLMEMDPEVADPFANKMNPLTADLDKSYEVMTKEDRTDRRKVYENLNPDLQAKAQSLSSAIRTNDQSGVLTFGSSAQNELTRFSEGMIAQVRTNEIGELGNGLVELMTELESAKPRNFDTSNQGFIKKWFLKAKADIEKTRMQYEKVGTNVDKIAGELQSDMSILLKDNASLEGLYEQNKVYYQSLSIYIAAGELRLDELYSHEIPAAIEAAKVSGDQMKVQEANDLMSFADRLDKRTHDLRLSRNITLQQAPQVRLIQNTNQALAEKIQSSIHTAIPLWKNQVAIALTLLRQEGASTGQRMVTETTNKFLIENSKLLKTSAVDTAKENERGVVDIETLQQTQSDLIETMSEINQIRNEGRQKRKEAEKVIEGMEDSLRKQMLIATGQTEGGQVF